MMFRCLNALVIACVACCCASLAAAETVVWIEGEQPVALPAGLSEGAVAVSAWGDTSVMSGQQVLQVNMDAKAVAEQVGSDGIVIDYAFTIAAAGKQQLWARIGYEWARSPFAWRIDDGAWNEVGADVPTMQIQPIQTWNELAWLQLDTMDLTAGAHRLAIRWSKIETTNKDGKTKVERLLGAVDCFCIATHFTPNGPWAPGSEWQSDADRAAADQQFALVVGGERERWSCELSGAWQFAAWEEFYPVDEAARLSAVRTLPDLKTLSWYAYQVPGDRNQRLPQWAFAHRWIARSRVMIPKEAGQRSFYLDLQRFSAVASVFVNGTFCDWSNRHSTSWQCDVSQAIKVGQVNEITIIFKDRYYSLDAGDEAMGNRKFWNLPNEFLSSNQGIAGKHQLAIAADPTTGLTEPITLVATGSAYAADVFCQTSVAKQELAVEITVRNPGVAATSVTVGGDIIPWNAGKGGEVELSLPSQEVTVAAGATATVTLTAPFPKAHLWWPSDPFLYWAKTTVSAKGLIDDVALTRFGFREWNWTTDHQFYLNGVRWQLWADLNTGGSKEALLKRVRDSGMNMIRLWSNSGMWGMTRRDTLAWMDEHGIMVRSSGTFDGQLANYGGGLREKGPDGKPQVKKALFDNWKEQLLAWVREERNHPSIFIWSIENEITYINSWNLGQWREVEPAMTVNGNAVMALDPTRPVMVDGGNALHDESMPVNGAHYTEFMNASWGDFPDAAYSREQYYDAERPQRGAWRMAPNKPIMMGEVYYANGYDNSSFATVGGDRCFIGIGESYAGRGLFGRILSEGYRWCGVSSWHFWMGAIGGEDRQYWNAWQPIAVLCRQWNWTFGASQHVERLLKVFNQTTSADPITVHWAVTVGDATVAQGDKVFALAPGAEEEWQIEFDLPPTAALRTTGTFTLDATRAGASVFHDQRELAIVNPNNVEFPKLEASAIACWDPSGLLSAHLTARNIPFTPIASPEAIPDQAAVVLVGPNALEAAHAADTTWYALAASGRRVVVFDQEQPLRYGGLPADAEPTGRTGRIAFIEDLSHPVFAGLSQSDLFTWGNDHVVYRQVWTKPTRGGRSLVQCDDRLGNSAVLECAVGDGLLIASQLAIGSKLASNGIAAVIADRMIAYAATWQPVHREVTAYMEANAPERQILNAIALAPKSATSPLAALSGEGIAIIAATPKNLSQLADAPDQVQAFCDRGGWLMLWGLTPDGLTAFNRVVGQEHVIRPFETERVLLATPSDPLTAGLTLRDVVMDTGEKMYPWMALKRPDSDAFSYVIDHTDIAPFCRFPTPMEMGKGTDTPGVDHWPRNLVNGFTSEDNWCFTYTTILDKGHSTSLTLELPKAEELVALKVRTSAIYHPVTRIDVRFDDDPEVVSAELRPEPLVQEVPVAGRRAKRITLTIAGWEERGSANIVVLDNLWLQAKRSDAYLAKTHSLLNVGALMRFDRGRGGILLNQIKVMPSERNPINAEKKQTIVKTLLANLGAQFAGNRTVVAGNQLVYSPVTIPDGQFTAYVNHRGQPSWFPGPTDLQSVPVGDQKFAAIAFHLSDFSTSPVPSALMTSGNGSQVKSAIAPVVIGRKADALFFLHTANPGPAIEGWKRAVVDAQRRRRDPPETPVIAQYVVTYDDGSTSDIRVSWGQDVDDWRQAAPQALPGAALAWQGQAVEGVVPTLWAQQWTNPHPELGIASVTLRASEDPKVGSVACLGITTAVMRKP